MTANGKYDDGDGKTANTAAARQQYSKYGGVDGNDSYDDGARQTTAHGTAAAQYGARRRQ